MTPSPLPTLPCLTADQYCSPHCFISLLFLFAFLDILVLVLLLSLSISDVVSSKRGDAKSFVPPWKTETGGVYRDQGGSPRKTFSLCLR